MNTSSQSALNGLEPEIVFGIFSQISKIPRESKLVNQNVKKK
jgi:hypothetical protein